MPLVKVSDLAHETIRRLAFEQRVSQGDVVADALIVYLDSLSTTYTQSAPVAALTPADPRVGEPATA